MMSKLTLMDELSSPPLSSSSRARNKARDVTRGYWSSCLSLRDMVSQLTLMDKLSSPPLGSSRRARNKSRDVARGYWGSCLSLSSLMYCHMVDIAVGEVCTGKALTKSDMVDVTEWIVLTRQSRRCGDWSLGAASTGQNQRDGDQQHHEKLPMTTTPM